ncbi:hypothetical protein [Mycobacterium shigaense]|uniref:Uncharacterized protein n=1 Tax=Mycobacterium shigaense TaxID=722731 RepID=A0A1Z4EL79_9MYCO|nr:hypothetical protein [Mycobacterium shigaense]MEA1121191.1 hypothetical protein [Mycobacterium shigaense]PRI14465.1 hypothetical protein B2J96_14005 [Mycobacterium shigaense]BAX93701.1 hypothetical protein MSG_03571 [Mycobacterium shigaense]
MTLIERTTKSANSLADQAVSTVSQVGTAIAEGIVVTAEDLRAGLKDGKIRPRTVLAAAAIGLVAVVEWPVLLVVGGGAFVASKFRKPTTDGADSAESTLGEDTPAPESAEPQD